MRKLIYLFILLLATSCYNNNLNNMRDFTYAGNLPIIGDTINNEVVHFIIDSGANISLIDTDYYDRNSDDFFILQEVEMQLFGISGISERRTSHTVILNTSLGRCTFQDSDLSAVVKQANSWGYNVIGLIGSDVLRDGYIINYETKQLTKCN